MSDPNHHQRGYQLHQRGTHRPEPPHLTGVPPHDPIHHRGTTTPTNISHRGTTRGTHPNHHISHRGTTPPHRSTSGVPPRRGTITEPHLTGGTNRRHQVWLNSENSSCY